MTEVGTVQETTEQLQKVYVEPETDLDTRWWFEALEQDRLEIPRCNACGRTFFPPQPDCPHCGAQDWRPIPAGGRGRIYSWVVCYLPFDPRFAEEVPYGILAVELEEGVRLFGRWKGDLDAIRADLRVQALVYRVDGHALLGWEAA